MYAVFPTALFISSSVIVTSKYLHSHGSVVDGVGVCVIEGVSEIDGVTVGVTVGVAVIVGVGVGDTHIPEGLKDAQSLQSEYVPLNVSVPEL